jgi:hypothetical protein
MAASEDTMAVSEDTMVVSVENQTASKQPQNAKFVRNLIADSDRFNKYFSIEDR